MHHKHGQNYNKIASRNSTFAGRFAPVFLSFHGYYRMFCLQDLQKKPTFIESNHLVYYNILSAKYSDSDLGFDFAKVKLHL